MALKRTLLSGVIALTLSAPVVAENYYLVISGNIGDSFSGAPGGPSTPGNSTDEENQSLSLELKGAIPAFTAGQYYEIDFSQPEYLLAKKGSSSVEAGSLELEWEFEISTTHSAMRRIMEDSEPPLLKFNSLSSDSFSNNIKVTVRSGEASASREYPIQNTGAWMNEAGVVFCPGIKSNTEFVVNGRRFYRVTPNDTYTLAQRANSACTTGWYRFGNVNFAASHGTGHITPLKIGHWDVSGVTTLADAFSGQRGRSSELYFAESLAGWDTSNVVSMRNAFIEATFKPEAGGMGFENWDVSNVKDMSSAFFRARGGVLDLNSWDISNVETMRDMFRESSTMPEVSEWKLPLGIILLDTFRDTSRFNSDIGHWNIENASSIDGMLLGAKAFSQDLRGWCVQDFTGDRFHSGSGWENKLTEEPKWGFCPISTHHRNTYQWELTEDGIIKCEWLPDGTGNGRNAHIINGKTYYVLKSLNQLKYSTASFLKGLLPDEVCTTQMTSLSGAFKDKSNPWDISHWDVSNVTQMQSMFLNAKGVTASDISKWDVSSVVNMISMFENSDFSGDISNWCVSGVTSRTNFDRRASSWPQANKPVWGTCPRGEDQL